MTEVLSLVVAAIGIGYGIFRDHQARDDRRNRERAEETLRIERNEREAQLLEPDLLVDMTGHSPEVGGLGRHMVTVRVRNKGKTVARDVVFGLRHADREFVAGPGGTPGSFPLLGDGDEVKWTMALSPGDMARLRASQDRIEAVMHPWARYHDKLAHPYEKTRPPPTQ